LNLVKQARVLDGDDGLGGEGRDKFNLSFGKWIHLVACEGEEPNGHPIAQEWHTKKGSETEYLLITHRVVFGIGQHVRNVNCPVLHRDSSRQAAAVGSDRMFQRILFRFA